MLKRIMSAVIGFPVLAVIIYSGGLPLQSMLMLLSLLGLNEFYRAFAKKNYAIHFVGYIFTVIYYLTLPHISFSWLLIFLTLFIITMQSCLVLFYKQVSLIDCIITIYGFFYVSFLLSFIFLIRSYNMGHYYVWLVFTSSFGCDTFAYFTGITLGRHKLRDTPSPSKSVEGIIGGVLGAALVGWLYGLFISGVFNEKNIHIIINTTVVSFAGAIFSLVGDMAASAIKRHTGIKDFGKIIPGHGGILDRFDSVMLTAPIVYMVMIAMIRISER